jgi:hypothetical protein
VTADPPETATPPLQPADELQFEPRPSIAIPLIVWLLTQLAAVALAASGVPLSANFPKPPQSLAVHEMLIAQFVGSAMSLDVLFRGGWRAWLGIVLTAGPMLMLAAWLARTPMSRVFVLWVHVAMWLTMLSLWRSLTSSDVRDTRDKKAQALPSLGFVTVLSALATLLSAGGLLFWYLRSEFQPATDSGFLRLFPLPAILSTLPSPAIDRSPLLSTAVLSAAAVVILAAKASRRRKNAQ